MTNQAWLRGESFQIDIDAESKKRDEKQAGKHRGRRRDGKGNSEDKSVHIDGHRNKKEKRTQPAEYYRYNNTKVTKF